MLADPVTIAASSPNPEIILAMTKSDGYGSERVDTNGGGYSATINHTPGKNGDRHYLRIALSKNATNPYSGLVQKQVAYAAISVFVPPFGFTTAEMAAVYKALVDTIADSEVTITRILQNQS